MILVTGGLGYIGSHTVVELQNSGYDVVIIDNLSNSQIEVLNCIETICGKRPAFEQIDLCDFDVVNIFLKKYRDIEAVIHFAAFKAVGESVEQPLKYYHNNIFSIVNLIEAIKSVGINNFVFSSSCTVYGQPSKLPVTEKSPIKKAFSPYGNTKQICEEIINDCIDADKNFKAISLRYFNPIGAHDSALIGELPLGVPSNLMPFITQTAIGKHEFLRVWGSDYDTPDGTAIRDYIHVVDLAQAHVVAVKRLIENQSKKQFETFNLGTGVGYSVFDVIKSFEKTSGVKLNYKMLERRSGDVEKIWADTSFANHELSWNAMRTLDEMTLSAWNWEKTLHD